jgi:MYXO-CTERM domain-containing protein
MSHKRAPFLISLLALSCSSGRSTEAPDAAAPSVAAPGATVARERAIVADLHRTFAGRREGDRVLSPIVHGGAHITQTEQGLVAETKLPTGANGRLARVRLPKIASEPFTVADGETSIDVRMIGASGAAAKIEGDAVVYERALGEATLVHIPTHAGTEEYVRFDAAPAERALHYAVDLHGVAGLRVVGAGVVELLDATGNPVLRTTAPQVIDANGKGTVGTIAVEGCSYDTSDAAPWGRPVTPPGASTCTVHARWSDEGLTYPLLVDPPWTNTGSLAYKRTQHTATKITGSTDAACTKGCVLVVGGVLSNSSYAVYSELFNASTGTFTAFGGLLRTGHASVDLENGSALVIGGQTSSSGTLTSVVYAYTPGTGWTAKTALPAARRDHAAVGKSKKAWVTGGRDSTDTLGNAWKYDFTANAWTAIDGLYSARRNHAMVYVSRSGTHSAVVAGGFAADGTSLSTAESISNLEDTTKLWTKTTGTMSAPRTDFVAVGDGSYVWLTGGANANVDRYTVGGTDSLDPWIVASTTITTNTNFGLEGGALKSGSTTRIAVFGGAPFLSPASRLTYLLNTTATTVAAASQGVLMNAGRTGFAAAPLIDGTIQRQLAVGGVSCTYSGFTVLTCTYPTYEEILALLANGDACSNDNSCASGMCRDGVCCNADCAGQCQYCADAGSVGTCKTIIGTPRAPRAACPTPNTGLCGFQCNGADPNNCVAPGSATSCGAATCSAGYQTTQATCNGSGSCTTGVKTACGKYNCNGTACYTSCTTNTQCAAGYKCDTGTQLCVSSGAPGADCTITSDCLAGNYCVDGVCCTASACPSGFKCNNPGAMGSCKLPYGAACTSGTNCPTGFCADGHCCDTACTGQCEQCGTGTCLPVPAGSAPATGHTACTGTGACQSKCDGSTRTACGPFPNTTTVCAAATCNASTRTATPTRYCDGLGGCPTAAATSCGGYTCDTAACRTSCTDNTACATGYYCGGGVCVPTGAAGTSCGDGTQCTSGFCVDGVCCTTSSCPTGQSCNATPNGVCKKAIGGACTTSTECGTGFCVDGLCCDSACTGQCEACNVGGSEGACTAVSGPPKGSRPACGGTGTCAAQCDGSNRTACGPLPGTLTICAAETCTAGAWTKTSTCNGAGACAAPSPVSCVPYVCGTGSCKTSCFNTTDCATGYACTGGVCVTTGDLGSLCSDGTQCKSGFCTGGPGGKKVCCTVDACAAGTVCADVSTPDVVGTCVKTKGSACTNKNECTTGFCIDGVCCDSACTGQCEACDVPGAEGTCSGISGAPHGTRGKCSDGAGDPCKALTCDPTLNRTKCAGFAAGAETECGESSCTDGNETPRGRCDGAGACTPSTKKTSCGAYACDAQACKTSCTTKADCASGYNCVDGKCAPITAKCDDTGLISIPTNGDTQLDCAPFRCNPATGDCFKICATTNDCVPGGACSSGRCEPPPPATTNDSGGCATSSPGTPGSWLGLGLSALALIGLGRARRRG